MQLSNYFRILHGLVLAKVSFRPIIPHLPATTRGRASRDDTSAAPPRAVSR